MSEGPKSLYLLGGVSFVASGVLFLAKGALELAMGLPPATGDAILAWMSSEQTKIAAVVEMFFFAVVLLVPAVFALHASLADQQRALAALGVGPIAMTLPLLAMLVVLYGRLVYPVVHIRVHTPEAAELTVALYYGGLHAVVLVLGGATGVLSWATRRGIYGTGLAVLGVVTAVLDVMAGYPEAIGAPLYFVCWVFFAAWLVGQGARLIAMSRATG